MKMWMNNRHLKKSMLLVLSLLIAFLSFNFIGFETFANSNDDECCEITVYMHKDKAILAPYLTAFHREYPNIKVNYVQLMNYESDMAALVEENNLPDVFYIPNCIGYDDYETYLAPLGTVNELTKKYNYLEKGVIKNGVMYGIPSFAYLFGFIYNKEVFSQAGISRLPKTMEEFLEDCELILQHTDAIPFYTNYRDRWAISYWQYYPFIEMTGSNEYRYTEFLDEEYPFKEGSPYYTVYKFLYDIVKNGYTENITKSEYGKCIELLKTGKIGAISIGSWAVKEIQGSRDILGFMPFPNSIDGQQYVTVTTDYCYGVSRNSKNVEAAKKFVTFMLDESGFAYDTGNISILNTDLYPEYMSGLSDVTLLYDAYNSEYNYELLSKLKTYIDPDSSDEIAKILEAAAGIRDESFDDIMTDWNVRWEQGRPSGIKSNVNADDNAKGNIVLIVNDQIKLSDMDKQYLENNPVLKAGYSRNNAPFSYERDGEFTGLCYGICSNIEEMIGMSFEYIGYDDETQLKDALRTGEIDLALGLYKDSKDELQYSKSFFEVLNVKVNNSEASESKDKDELSEISTSDIFKMLDDGKLASYETNFNTANFYMQQLGTTNIDITPYSTYSTLHFVLSANQSSTLLSIINKCLYALKSQDVQVMLFEYGTPDTPPVTIKRLIITNPILFVTLVLIFVSIILFATIAIAIQRVISHRRKAFEMQKYRMLSALADEYMFEYDFRSKFIKFDDKCVSAFGFSETIFIDDVCIEGELKVFVSKLRELLNNSENVEPFELAKLNGERIWFKPVVSYMNDSDGNPMYLIGKMANVQKEMENMMSYQQKAEKDELTGINNRRGFYDELKPKAQRVLFAVVDIDDFKGVNDNLGHSGGDKVLCFVVEQMEKIFGENAILGRYGGDEFMVVITDIMDSTAKAKLEEFVNATNVTIEHENNQREISVSIGAVYSANETFTHALFDKADGILYEIKESGKNSFKLICL